MVVDEKHKMTTLAGVDQRVNELSRNCWDDNVQKKISVSMIFPVSEFPVKAIISDRLHKEALSARLGVPYQYLKKCPSYLQAENLNHWIEEESNDEFFVTIQRVRDQSGIHSKIYPG